MAELVLRAVAAAGVLSIGVLAGAAPVLAQPSDSDSSSQSTDSPDSGDGDSGTDTGTTDGSTGGSTGGTESPGSTEPEPDEVTVIDEDEPATSGGTGTRNPPPPPDTYVPPKESRKVEYENSLTVPFLRLPPPGEIPAGSWPTVSSFYTTVRIPLPTLGEFLATLRLVPAPPPPPGPQMGIMREGPVLDAGTGTQDGAVAGGGGGGGSGATAFRVPLVVSVPRAMTTAGARPRALAARPGQPVDPATTAPGVAGVRTPVIRGSVAPTPGTTVAAAPMGGAPGQVPRPAGYPRVLTGPTLAEIAAVALPGLAGLMLVTFGGSVVGYRQANSLRYVRTAGAERFLP
ncbi:hypothetical protein [Mycolicibacterium vaccae]|uniref:hypothetical protein n=1 Tax=Mycolicibacterium vaccae TaxID=1810 RepID=UPI003CFCDF51